MINRAFCRLAIWGLFLSMSSLLLAQEKNEKRVFRVMEYNVENLFDCQHDSLKDDYEFSENGSYHWTSSRYWKKLNAVARGIVLASTHNDVLQLPDIIGLSEVENDSVMHSLCHRSLLRGAGYEYVMTNSPDVRGVDVALLYQPYSFRLINSYSLRVDTIKDMRPTRDILYVKGEIMSGIIHAFVVHAPSRRGGARETNPFRRVVMKRLVSSLDSIRATEPAASIIVMGDFNAYDRDPCLAYLTDNGLTDITSSQYITRNKKVRGTYRYQGEWGSLDHILVSDALLKVFSSSAIADHEELLEDDEKYGGVKPYRFFQGPTIRGGFSDHLPLTAEFLLK